MNMLPARYYVKLTKEENNSELKEDNNSKLELHRISNYYGTDKIGLKELGSDITYTILYVGVFCGFIGVFITAFTTLGTIIGIDLLSDYSRKQIDQMRLNIFLIEFLVITIPLILTVLIGTYNPQGHVTNNDEYSDKKKEPLFKSRDLIIEKPENMNNEEWQLMLSVMSEEAANDEEYENIRWLKRKDRSKLEEFSKEDAKKVINKEKQEYLYSLDEQKRREEERLKAKEEKEKERIQIEKQKEIDEEAAKQTEKQKRIESQNKSFNDYINKVYSDRNVV